MTDNITVSRELLRQVIDSLKSTCGHRCNAEYNPCHEQELVWQLKALLDAPAVEPFGYFRAEPFGWTDCAQTDEGAKALYEAPQAQ